MFTHLFINKLKILLKNKAMLFWTLIFPFILGTFFQLALSNISKSYEFKVIPIAIIDDLNSSVNENFYLMMSSLEKEDSNQLFTIQYVSEDEAKELLQKEEIEGYIIFNDINPQLVIKNNGINQTIIKYVLDEYYQLNSVAMNMIEFNPQNITNGALELLSLNNNYVKDNSVEKVDFSINYFFTLIAMTCLYGSLIGLNIVEDSEANLSFKGARVSMAPISKLKMILSCLLAGYVIQLIALGLLFAYLILVFHVNFSNQVIPTIILAMVGCFLGLSLGAFIGVSNKKSESFKIGVLIALIMSCCFFAGMMGTLDIKIFFDEKFPLLAKINPVNMITDGLYALFAYSSLDVYYHCLIRIIVFSLVLIALTYLFVRRKSYDSL